MSKHIYCIVIENEVNGKLYVCPWSFTHRELATAIAQVLIEWQAQAMDRLCPDEDYSLIVHTFAYGYGDEEIQQRGK